MNIILKLLIFVALFGICTTTVTTEEDNGVKGNGNILPNEAISLNVLLGSISQLDGDCSQESCDRQCRAVQWSGGVCYRGECWCYRY
ncbi:hypothetical protein NQ317_016389 [Molorchus minor]|uniref:Defensin n=1 Tax=Molorchus minor TaxID=1323400 RepID=A0ABQ9JJU8_9CUCU|nr:hypothetical protein NQ317_016389 [Molorchus minor]